MNLFLYAVPFALLSLLMEWRYSLKKNLKLYRWNDTLSNMSAGIFQVALDFVPASLFIFLYPKVLALSPISFFAGKRNLLVFVACWLCVDFFYYWAHRTFHRTGLGWTGHVVHHQSEEYNLSVALRQSWPQQFHGIPFYLLTALVGFDLEVAVTSIALNLIYQFWIHTHLIQKMPAWFEAVFNTPSHHRVHHGRNAVYLDKNYAGSLIIWDKIFGSFEAESEKPVFGVTQPVQDWRLMATQFGPLRQLYKKTRGKSLKVKLLYLIKPPGWNEIDGEAIPELTLRDKVPEPSDSNEKRIAFACFFLATGLLPLFMALEPRLDWAWKISYGLGFGLLLAPVLNRLNPAQSKI